MYLRWCCDHYDISKYSENVSVHRIGQIWTRQGGERYFSISISERRIYGIWPKNRKLINQRSRWFADNPFPKPRCPNERQIGKEGIRKEKMQKEAGILLLLDNKNRSDQQEQARWRSDRRVGTKRFWTSLWSYRIEHERTGVRLELLFIFEM